MIKFVQLSSNLPSSWDTTPLPQSNWGGVRSNDGGGCVSELEQLFSIPPNLIQNLCKYYLYRIYKVRELNGDRLEPEHLKKEKHDEYKWKKIEELPRVRMAYNDRN